MCVYVFKAGQGQCREHLFPGRGEFDRVGRAAGGEDDGLLPVAPVVVPDVLQRDEEGREEKK